MHRTLQITRSLDLANAVSMRALISRVTACVAVALGCWNNACAQQASSNYPISSTTMNLGANPVSSGADLPIVDASYFGPKDSSGVQKASYGQEGYVYDGGLGTLGSFGEMGYQELCNAECQPGAYSCIRCDISCYTNVEALAFRREGDRRFSLTQNAFLDRGDYEFGTRATVGWMCDCANAIELVYVGPFDWTRSSVLNGNDNVDSRFLTVQLSTLDDSFNNADQHTQTLRQRANSFEINRRQWAWDSVSTLIGLRYFQYDERYDLRSVRSAQPLLGQYSDDIENHLFGAQIGGDLFFVTSLRTSISLRGKAGVYANVATREAQIRENGASILFNGRDEVDIAGLFEFGMFGNYQITPSVRFNIGYEIWYMPGMGTISHENPQFLLPSSGTSLSLRDDLLLHGFNGGIQILR